MHNYIYAAIHDWALNYRNRSEKDYKNLDNDALIRMCCIYTYKYIYKYTYTYKYI